MTYPRVSVVIPAYNSARLIGETLRSVLAQSYTNFEIIVVDDGSTDGTVNTVRDVFPGVRCLRQENQGVAAARNRGIAEARGDYIAFIDSDDLWYPDSLATKVAALDENPDVGMVFSNFEIFDESGAFCEDGMPHLYPFFQRSGKTLNQVFAERKSIELGEGKTTYLLTGGIFDDLFLGNFILTSTCVLRRKSSLAAGLFRPELRTQEDWDFFLRLSRSYVIGCVDAALVRYRRHANQLTGAGNIENILEVVLFVIDTYEKHFSAQGKERKFRHRKAETLANLAKVRVRLGKSRSARSAAAQSVRLNPLRPGNVLTLALSWTPSCLIQAGLALLRKERW